MSLEKVNLNVNGMSCEHCVSAVKNAVGKLDGISEVSVDLDKKIVNVIFDNEKTCVKDISNIIEDQGFDVVK